jgi:hypothetical protein
MLPRPSHERTGMYFAEIWFEKPGGDIRMIPGKHKTVAGITDWAATEARRLTVDRNFVVKITITVDLTRTS